MQMLSYLLTQGVGDGQNANGVQDTLCLGVDLPCVQSIHLLNGSSKLLQQPTHLIVYRQQRESIGMHAQSNGAWNW